MGKSQRIVAWVSSHPMAGDIPLAALWTLLSIPATIQYPQNGILFTITNRLIIAAWSVAISLPVAFRRTHPEHSAIAFATLSISQLIFGPSLLPADAFAIIMVYSAIVYGRPEHTKLFIVLTVLISACVPTVVTWSSVVGPVSAIHNSAAAGPLPLKECRAIYTSGIGGQCAHILLYEVFQDALGIFVIMLATCVIAYWQRARRATIGMLQERNEAIAARNEEERHIARLAERARIARDMHDVVAHTLSTVITQADGGRYAATHDLKMARLIMETVRGESMNSLANMKSLLGTFGTTAHHGYSQIGTLVNQTRAEGITITRTFAGSVVPARLSTQASTTVYRVVQEALTNVRKYAGTPVHVAIHEQWDDGELKLNIADDGQGMAVQSNGHKPGYGLIGMHERVENLGGELEAGPQEAGGFGIHAVIPFRQRKDSVVASRERHHTATNADQPTSWNGTTIRNQETQRKAQATKSGTRQRANVMERLSRWTSRHYLSVDICFAVLMLVVMGIGNELSIIMLSAGTADTVIIGSPDSASAAFFDVTIVGALLALRRRLPRLSATAGATLAAAHMVFAPVVPTSDFLILILLYSVFLYSNRMARIWEGLAALAVCLLFSAKGAMMINGYQSLFNRVTGVRNLQRTIQTPEDTALTFFILLMASGAVCLAVIAAALWTRLGNSNALVLRSRAEALTTKQERQKVLAANLERRSISSEMQQDITNVLDSVNAQAVAGLDLLDTIEHRNYTPDTSRTQSTTKTEGQPDATRRISDEDAQLIADAFASIARQGRDALTRMRSLLDILRETETSPTQSHDAPRLHPVGFNDSADATAISERRRQ